MVISTNLVTNLFHTYFTTLAFRKIQNIFDTFDTINLSDTYTCTIHVLLCFILGIAYYITNNDILIYTVFKISTGFFISDIFTNLSYEKFTNFNITMILHHFLSICGINFLSVVDYKVFFILFILELSNIL